MIACGLYYLAELVEEYTVLTKKIIKGLTLVRARTRQATDANMNQDVYQQKDITDFYNQETTLRRGSEHTARRHNQPLRQLT